MNSVINMTNYQLINKNNIYNTFIYVIENEKDNEQKKKIINLIKMNIGITFYNDMMGYLLKKNPQSELLKL